MTVAFTICSNNFFAQARVMFASLLRHHPGMKTILFLADEKDDAVDYSLLGSTELVLVNEEVVEGFSDMVARYTILELNTAVRPFLYKYLVTRYSYVDKTWYIDPDMYIFRALDELDGLLESYDIIITPHFTEPIPMDGLKPFEDLALDYGIYNVGFLALNIRNANTRKFIEWWGQRTSQFGYADIEKGMFADQIWFNLVPVFFERVHVLRDKGYNMAIWNLHERRIKKYHDDGSVELDSGEFLAIYHYSNWNYFEPKELSKGLNRYNFENRSDLVRLYQDYHTRLNENDHDRLRRLPCRLAVRKLKRRSRLKRALSPGVNIIRGIWHKI